MDIAKIIETIGAIVQFSREIISGSANGELSVRPIILISFITSVIITLLIILVQPFGIFQKFELRVYDHLIQLQSDEKDERILIITIDKEDIEYQDQLKMEREAKSISDEALGILLEKLNQHQPSVIGLDIFRDFPAKSKSLATLLKENENLIATCLVDRVKSPPEIAEEHRLGFANIPQDPDRVIRRQFLGMAKPSNSICQTDDSLSFQIALSYLKQERKSLDIGFTANNNNLIIDNTIFHKFEFDTGGYQLPRTEDQGYQILINYRSAQEIVQQIPLREILDGSQDSSLPKLVHNKIILIGNIDETFHDFHMTPYSNNQPSKKMPGVIIQAQMISQILRAVLDDRPLLRWWPQWQETLWAWIWSVVGSAIGLYYLLRSHSFFKLFLAIVSALGILYLLTSFLFGNGLWIPIIPSALALMLSSLIIVLMNSSLGWQHQQNNQ